jgi:hypothetical protein
MMMSMVQGLVGLLVYRGAESEPSTEVRQRYFGLGAAGIMATTSVNWFLEPVSNYTDEGFTAVHATAMTLLALCFVANAGIVGYASYTKTFNLLVFRFPFYISLYDMFFGLVHFIDHAYLVARGNRQRPAWAFAANQTANGTDPGVALLALNDQMNSGASPWIVSSPTATLLGPPNDPACLVISV